MLLKREKEILAHNHVAQAIIVGIIIFIIAFFQFDLRNYLTLQAFQLGDFEAFNDAFVRFGISLLFFYHFLPQSFMIIGITPILVRLLDGGVSPVALLFIIVIGRTIGQVILYGLGRFLSKTILKNKSKFKGADHFLHKYRTLVFVMVPFFGFIGDAIILIAGHQRIGLLKILPLLMLGSFIRNALWIGTTTIQLSLPGFF